MRVLIIEDDSATSMSMELMLRSEGFSVQTTDLGEEGVDLARHYEFDCVILDLHLPDISGFDVLRQLRAGGTKTPVLICSGTTDLETKVKTLGAGADDFLGKPFHKDELVARLRALVRRSQGHAEPFVSVGPLRVLLDRRVAEVNGARVHLTGKEWQMLELLALRRDGCVTKDTFMNHLYGGLDEPDLKIIDVFICKLRRKLKAAGAGRQIKTIWGRGYALSEDASEPERPMGRHMAAKGEETSRRVLARLLKGAATAADIMAAAGITESCASEHLQRLQASGDAVRLRGKSALGPAVYALAAQGEARVL